MSENAAVTPNATPAAPAVKLDEFGQMAKDRLVATINEHNGLAARVKAASGDAQTLLETLRDNPPNDEVAKINQQISDLLDKVNTLEEKRDAALRPVVTQMQEDAKSGLGDAEAKAADLLKTINAGKKYLSDLYGEAAVADLPKVVGRRASSGGSGGGGGQRRIRGFDVYIDGTLATGRNGKGEQVSNMAAAAKTLGVDTEDLRNAFWQAAGTDDSSKYPPVVEFTVTVTEGEGDAAKPVVKTIVAKRVNDGEARATEAEPAA